MPFWIEGWVEVRRPATAEDDTNQWRGVIRISPVIDGPDRVSEKLFGLAKKSDAILDAFASDKGIPAHPSAEVRADIERINAHESKYGSGEYGGYTYATWNEISQFRNSSAPIAGRDWSLLFSIAEVLSNDERFGKDGIRFVVWYSW